MSFWGENILWQEIDVPGQSGHLAMASTRTGEHVNLPEPLASIHHLAYLATSDDLVTWGDGSSVWVWRPGEQRLQQLVNNRMGRPQFLSIVGGMIAWDENDGPVMADLRSGSLTRLTERYGGRFARGKALVVYHPPEGKLRPGMALLSEGVDVSRLPPLPACGQ